MANIAVLTVEYRSKGFRKGDGGKGGVMDDVEALAAAGASIEKTGIKAAQAASGVDKAAAATGNLSTESGRMASSSDMATAALMRWVARLDAANQRFGKTNLELLQMSAAFEKLTAEQSAHAIAVTQSADAYASVGRLLTATLTPIRAYGSAIGELNILLQNGNISQQEFAAAMARASREYDVNSGAVARSQAAYRELIEAQEAEVAASKAVAESAAREAAAERQREAALVASARAAQMSANAQRSFSGLVGGPPDEFRTAQLAAMRRDAMAVWPAFETSGSTAIARVEAKVGGLGAAIRGLGDVFKHAFGGLIAFGAVAAIAEFGRSIIDANRDMQKMLNTLNAASGSMEQAKGEFSFLAGLADKLGTDLQGSADGYARLAVSARAAGISTSQLHTSFTGLSEGFAATGRSGDEMNRFLVQMEQGLSQGTIQMRDLRAMAQSFPAAFEIAGEAAKRMGGSLDSFLKQGGLPAEQFFVTFSEIVHEKFAKAAEEASNTLVGQLNRIKNALFESKTGADALAPLTAALKALADELNSDSGRQHIQDLVKNIVDGFKAALAAVVAFIQVLPELIAALKVLATIYAVRLVSGGIGAFRNAMVATTGVIGESVSVLRVLTSTTTGLSFGMRAAAVSSRALGAALAFVGGPVGLAILALSAAYELVSHHMQDVLAKQKAEVDALEKQRSALHAMNVKITEYNKSVGATNALLSDVPSLSSGVVSANADQAQSWLALAHATLESNKALVQAKVLAGQQAADRLAFRQNLINTQFGGVDPGAAALGKVAPQLLGTSVAGDTATLRAGIMAKNLQTQLEEQTKAVEKAFGSTSFVPDVRGLMDQSGMTSKMEKYGEAVRKLAGEMNAAIKNGMDPARAAEAFNKGREALEKIRDRVVGAAGSVGAESALDRVIQSIGKSTVEAQGQLGEYTKRMVDLTKAFDEDRAHGMSLQAAMAKWTTGHDQITAALKRETAAQEALSAVQQKQYQDDLMRAIQLRTAQGLLSNRNDQMGPLQFQQQQSVLGIQQRYQQQIAQLRSQQGIALLQPGADAEKINADFGAKIKAQEIAQTADLAAQQQLYNDKLEQMQKILPGIKGGFQEFADTAMNLTGEMHQAVNTFLTGFADGLSTMLTGGKSSFKELLRSFVQMVNQMITRWLVMRVITGKTDGLSFNFMGGLAKGGAFDQSGRVRFASGGIVNSPTLFQFAGGTGLMGEAGPEAIMPLKRDSQGRLGVHAQGSKEGGRPISISYNIDARGAGPDEVAKLAQMRVETIRKVHSDVVHYDKYGYFPSAA